MVGHGDWSMHVIAGFGGCVGREFGKGLEVSLECFLEEVRRDVWMGIRRDVRRAVWGRGIWRDL